MQVCFFMLGFMILYENVFLPEGFITVFLFEGFNARDKHSRPEGYYFFLRVCH